MPTAISRVWYDTLLDDDGSGQVGSILTKEDFNSLLNAIDALLAAPIAFGAGGTAVSYIDLEGDSAGSGTPFRIGRGPLGMYSNTQVGSGALGSISTVAASGNSAIGYQALGAVTTGSNNTALGVVAGGSITDGAGNTAIGYHAYVLGVGNSNTVIGNLSLRDNATGDGNTCVGASTMTVATGSEKNTAIGEQALGTLTTGDHNTALGSIAGYGLTTGVKNVCVGWNAGTGLTTETGNVIIGGYAGVAALSNRIYLADGEGNLRWTIDNTGSLVQAVSTNDDVLTLNSSHANGPHILVKRSGANVGVLGSFVRAGGLDDFEISAEVAGKHLYLTSASGEIRSTTIYNDTSGAPAANVGISSTGRLQRNASSRRYKDDIAPLTDYRFLLDLQPVTYRDLSGQPWVGLVAEDVAAVDPRFVLFDAEGRPDGVAYTHLTAPLIAWVKHLAARVDALEAA